MLTTANNSSAMTTALDLRSDGSRKNVPAHAQPSSSHRTSTTFGSTPTNAGVVKPTAVARAIAIRAPPFGRSATTHRAHINTTEACGTNAAARRTATHVTVARTDSESIVDGIAACTGTRYKLWPFACMSIAVLTVMRPTRARGAAPRDFRGSLIGTLLLQPRKRSPGS